MKIKVPENLNEITVGQYQKYLSVHDNVGECEFLNQKMIEIFCNVKLGLVLNIQATSVQSIVNTINGLFNTDHKHIQTFKINGKEFGFIPDVESMSFGEYVEIEEGLKSWETMHEALATMYRPIERKNGDKYLISPHTGNQEFAEMMKFAPVEVALGAVFFFWNLGNELLKAIPSFLEEELKTILTAKKVNSKEIGDGITAYMHSLKETLDDLMKSQPFLLNNVYSS